MRLRLLAFASIVAVLGAPLAVQAQGVVRGVQEGADVGHRAAGPVGGAVGGAVGGVVGGVAGGVKGVLGVPQRSGVRTYKARRYHSRHRRYRSR